MNSKHQFLTIEEKRAWLARIFRDTSGEYSDADKLKALEADNRLLSFISQNHEIKSQKRNKKYRKLKMKSEKVDSSSSKPKVDNSKTCSTCLWLVPYGYSQCGKQYGWCDARSEYRYTTQKCKRYKKYDRSTES